MATRGFPSPLVLLLVGCGGSTTTSVTDGGPYPQDGSLLEVARDIGADPIVHEIESHGERPLRQLLTGGEAVSVPHVQKALLVWLLGLQKEIG